MHPHSIPFPFPKYSILRRALRAHPNTYRTWPSPRASLNLILGLDWQLKYRQSASISCPQARVLEKLSVLRFHSTDFISICYSLALPRFSLAVHDRHEALTRPVLLLNYIHSHLLYLYLYLGYLFLWLTSSQKAINDCTHHDGLVTSANTNILSTSTSTSTNRPSGLFRLQDLEEISVPIIR